MRISILLIAFALLAASNVARADVVLTFDNDTQGFGNSFGSGSTFWSPNHGGSLAIQFNSSGWTNPVAMISMTIPILNAEFLAALANGGTLSFDYIVRQEDVAGYNASSPPNWFELVLVANSDSAVGGGWDQNVIGGAAGYYGGIPQGYTTKVITMGVLVGPPNATDNNLTFGSGSGWNEVMIGLNSQNGAFTGATVYIDNFRLSAIPEPTSAFFLGLMSVGACLRRKRVR